MINITIVYDSKTKSNKYLKQFENVLNARDFNISMHDMADAAIPLHMHFNKIKDTESDLYFVLNSASFELRTESDDWSLNHISGIKVLIFTDDKINELPSPQKVGDDREQLSQFVYDIRTLKDDDNLNAELCKLIDEILKEAELI